MVYQLKREYYDRPSQWIVLYKGKIVARFKSRDRAFKVFGDNLKG